MNFYTQAARRCHEAARLYLNATLSDGSCVSDAHIAGFWQQPFGPIFQALATQPDADTLVGVFRVALQHGAGKQLALVVTLLLGEVQQSTNDPDQHTAAKEEAQQATRHLLGEAYLEGEQRNYWDFLVQLAPRKSSGR